MSFCLFFYCRHSTESLAERKLRIQRETRCIELKASGQIQRQQQAITMLYVLFNFTCKSASHSWGFHRFQIQIFTTSIALSQPGSLGRTRLSNEEAGYRAPAFTNEDVVRRRKQLNPVHLAFFSYSVGKKTTAALPIMLSPQSRFGGWNVASAIWYFTFLQKPAYVSIYRLKIASVNSLHQLSDAVWFM